jgi:hypothetical protein
LVGEINDKQSADDRRGLAPEEAWQIIRTLHDFIFNFKIEVVVFSNQNRNAEFKKCIFEHGRRWKR